MKHWLVYHNPDAMGYPVESIDDTTPYFNVVTDKPVKEAIGDRVWLLTGEGTPRTYSLVYTFIVDEVVASGDSAFGTELRGRQGTWFRPRPRLNDLTWFEEFRKRMGFFAFGLTAIKDRRFVDGLSEAASKVNPNWLM